jgi:hypothetical protein
MRNKFKAHFMQLGARRFVWAAVALLIVLDLINSLYLRLYWVHKDLSVMVVKRLANSQGLEFGQLTQQTIVEVQAMINNAFFFFLFIILINNIFFYGFYLRKKLWAQGYVLFYTISNSILAITFLVEGKVLGWGWFLYNLASMFLYFYLYLGVKVLKFETTDVTHSSEMKGQ